MAVAIALIDHHMNLGQMELGMRLRIACSSLVYRKILRLSKTSANKTAGGQIINLLSNDVSRFDQVFIFLHYIWIMPIQGGAIAYLIWRQVNIAAFAGVFLITIQTIPLQGYLGKWASKLRSKIAPRTDERVRLMSEIINGIQVIKMYTWEKPFQQLVSLSRKYEIDVLTIASYLRGFNRATFVFTERTSLFITIFAFVLLDNHISADIVFSLAQYYNRMQCTMAIFYPMAIAFASEAHVSIKRIEKFLQLEENIPLSIDTTSSVEKNSIIIKNVTASWLKDSISNTLHDINLNIKSGKLCALIGPVGCGKSSMLQLILGELRAIHGSVIVSGKVSYASQEPWLFSGSVRNNILFGQKYDDVKYKKVTRACSLIKDFIQLPQGDKSLVGERGTSLSGGQRARINLARAVYRDADIYLFDDPLSAVDTHVGKCLFQDCINGYLKNKTRILVTHQVQYLKNVDSIVMLNNGVIDKQGEYNDFNKQQFEIITASHENLSDKSSIFNNDDYHGSISELSITNNTNDYDNDDAIEEPKETEELMGTGSMKKSLFWKFFRAGGSIFSLLLFCIFLILGQFGSSGSDFWIAYWTKKEEIRLKYILNINNSQTENSTLYFNDEEHNYFDKYIALWIYGGFISLCVIMTTARNVMFYKICMNASKNLHNTMFSSILKAPMRFFDTHPSGQILNRFSKDIGSIDEQLPMAMIDSIQIFAVMIGILSQVIIINYLTIFPMIIMGIFYIIIRNTYLSTAQDLKRLEGITKSPVFSHVNSSLSGLITIRSSGGQEMIRKEFDGHQDVHTSANSLMLTTSTAFGLWLDAVTITFVAFITYSFIYFNDGDTSASNVGLALSQILILCGMLQHGMRQTAEMVAQMTSVERVMQFTDLDKEGPFDSEPNKKPSSTWPSKGEIKFQNVYLRYSDDDASVLKDLNITIESGMKIGIVGRTGAGKSSLISALFNLTRIEGNIIIDDIDTRKIGLHDLRSKISIIPQEPMLFSATLRDNLDPFHKYEDAILWSALEEVELKQSVESLDHIVTQGGSNFSAGQRQLLCLARAIVKNNKILVLDEATANVDPTTDSLIQKTIRTKFNNCTVLTIAHRLNTVMDSDKIIVMDHGKIVEFDHPHVLMQKSDGYLISMVNETGKTMTNNLKKISEKAFNKMTESQEEENDDNDDNVNHHSNETTK